MMFDLELIPDHETCQGDDSEHGQSVMDQQRGILKQLIVKYLKNKEADIPDDIAIPFELNYPDGVIFIDVILRNNQWIITLYCALEEINPNKRFEIYETLLKANLLWRETGGATLSLVGEAIQYPVIGYRCKDSLDEISSKSLFNTIDRFADLKTTWNKQLKLINDSSIHTTETPDNTAELNQDHASQIVWG